MHINNLRGILKRMRSNIYRCSSKSGNQNAYGIFKITEIKEIIWLKKKSQVYLFLLAMSKKLQKCGSLPKLPKLNSAVQLSHLHCDSFWLGWNERKRGCLTMFKIQLFLRQPIF